jgi:predicted nucleic acid-binding protein
LTVNKPCVANILSVHDGILDKVVFLDTNTILYALAYPELISEGLIGNHSKNTALKNNYLDFIQRLGYADSIGIYTVFNKEEIRHICQKLVARRKATIINCGLDEWQSIYTKYPELQGESIDLSNRIFNLLNSTPYLHHFPIHDEENLDSIVDEILSEAPINSKDAYIIATALQYDVNSIVSEDGDFSQVKGINLYTANQSVINNTSTSRLISFDVTRSLYQSLATNDSNRTSSDK